MNLLDRETLSRANAIRHGICPDCDGLAHRDLSTTTACLCGEWTPEKIYTGCKCIAAQPRCANEKNFTVKVMVRNG